MREWRELPIVYPGLEPPPLNSLFVGVKGLVGEAGSVLAHVLEALVHKTPFGFRHCWIRLAEGELPLATLQLMPMSLIAVPPILDWSAGSEVFNSVVKPVSVHVVYDLAPRGYHVVQIRNNLMQCHPKARYIATLVDMPSRPWQLVPGSRIKQKFHIISQGFHNGKVSNNAELVFNPRLPNLLIIVAKSTYEVVCHMWKLYLFHAQRHLYRPITWSLNSLFHGTPMLYFWIELKWQWIGRTTLNPEDDLSIIIGSDTTASHVGSSCSCMSDTPYPNTN